MLTQEEFVNDVLALKHQGLTIAEIAQELGYHPATISKWLASGGPPERRQTQAPPLIDERWAARIAELLARSPRLLATSVYEILVAEEFEGSYPTVSRHLHELRGPRFRAAAQASVPIETAPGEEVLCGKPHRASYVASANMRRRRFGGHVLAARGRVQP